MLQSSAKDTPASVESASATPSQIREAFERLASRRWEISARSVDQRIGRLKKLHAWIAKNATAIEEAIHSDLGRPPVEGAILDVTPSLSECEFAMKNLADWAAPKPVSTPLALAPATSELRYEAKGVVLVIGPWNYPFYLLSTPLVSAIAAGNVVAIKPSELSPATSRLVARMVKETFEPGEVEVLEGGAEVSTELLKLPFDHYFYTGGGPVGKIVMKAAAEHLASVTLELGGKSPAILGEDASIELAADRIAWGKFVNCGQTCVAPDYVLVPESKLDSFIAAIEKRIRDRYGADENSRRDSRDLGRIVNARHVRRLRDAVEKSIASGARALCGNQFVEAERYVAPTLLVDVKPEHAIMQEEIFGPILPVLPYRNLDEVFSLIRGLDKPLALYVFSRSRRFIDRVLAGTTSGGVTVNDCNLHVANPNLPFGGVGASGLGSYHGEYGFKAFSHERAVLKQSPVSPVPLLYPPYNSTTRKVVQLIRKIL